MEYLRQLVKVTPGFKASINLQTDLGDTGKIAGYIPTMFSVRLLEEVALGLQAKETRRVFLVHGAYGTGKSHLGLVASAYLGHPWVRGEFAPVLDKIRGMDSEAASSIGGARKELGDPILVVPLYGSEAHTRESLLVALDAALHREGLQDVMPETAFNAAVARIEQFRKSYPDSVPDMEGAFRNQGYRSLDAVIGELKRFSRQALSAFDAAHPHFSRGARADHVLAQSPESVYLAVSRALRQLPSPQRRSGILVLWDEFGLHLERVLGDPKQQEYMDLQKFVEQCSGSGEERLFFLGLAHRSIEQTVSMITGLPANQREVLNRIAGRFIQRRVVSGPGEQFGLLSRVLLPVDPKLKAQFWSSRKSWLHKLTVRVQELGLFGSMSGEVVQEVIIRDTFPMHPVATFLLPIVSEKVAQNDRTLFHFMSDTGPDGLPDFIKSEPLEIEGRLNLLSGDRLFAFFAPMMAASRHEDVKTHWTRFKSVAPQLSPLRKRVLEAIFLLSVANRPELRPTPVGIALTLGFDLDDVSGIDSELERMRKDKLVRRSPAGEFELRNVDGEVDLLEAMETAISDVPLSTDLMPFWEKWAPDAGLGGDIPASGHNQRYAINRAYRGEIASLKTIRETRYKEQGAPRGMDGVAYWIVPGSQVEYEEALAISQVIENPRVLVILPQAAPEVAPLARKFIALSNLQRQYPQAFGPTGVQREEWEIELNQLQSELTQAFEQAYKFPVVYLKGKPTRCRSSLQVSEIATIGMDEAFPLTLRIPHDRLIDVNGSDSQKVHRSAVVQATLSSPLEQLAEMPIKPVAFIVDAVLKATGWLRQEKGSWVLSRPNEKQNPNSAAVWDKIDTHIKAQTKKLGTCRFLLDELTGPPFGLRPRTLPVLLAAVLRVHAVSLTFVSQGSPVELSADIIERMVRDPGSVNFVYAALRPEQRWVLDQVSGALTSGPASDQAPLRQAERLLAQFVGKLPDLTKKTRRLREPTREIRDQVLIPLAEGQGGETKFRKALFETLPLLCGLPQLNSANLSAIKGTVGLVFPQAVRELKGFFEDQAMQMLAEVFGAKSSEMDEVKSAARSFVGMASTKPRSILNASEVAFINAARQSIQNPMAHLDEFAAALGFPPALSWTEEDMIALKAKGTYLRESLLEREDHQASGPTSVPSSTGSQQDTKLARSRGDLQAVKQDSAADKVEKPEQDPQHPDKATVRKLAIDSGNEAIAVTVGGVLPEKLKYALTAVQTALRGQRLSREERLQVIAEVLADVLETGRASKQGGGIR